MPYFTGTNNYGQQLVDAICAAIESTGKWGDNIASNPPSVDNRWCRVYKSVAKVNNKQLTFDISLLVEPTTGVGEPNTYTDIWSNMYGYYSYGLVIGGAYDYTPGITPSAGVYIDLRRCTLFLACLSSYTGTNPIEWHLIVEDTFIFLAIMDVYNTNTYRPRRACGFFGSLTPHGIHPDGIGVILLSSTKSQNLDNYFTTVDGPCAKVNHNVFHTVPIYGTTAYYERFSSDRQLYLHPILVYTQPTVIYNAMLIGSIQNVFATKLKRSTFRDLDSSYGFVKTIKENEQPYLLVWPYATAPPTYRWANNYYSPYNGFQYGMSANDTGAIDFVLAVKYQL
ncbi:hypothetical protein DCCM_0410 [Desulfocucumis palustris]|uniref:Uncharacterized protein n=1 Tax=Desulfocucumis palustris TaxID=1898651 RepID=A0A2L2X7Q2_9FIRM|nr:hypothetical protein [Desulfocucumis palustris]GBF32219.1 hypothetical protein DCCM_0410 [Desulfocucumis palustris]